MRRKGPIHIASGAALLVVMSLGSLAFAQPPSETDGPLLKLSMQGNIAEVELGRLAITRSSNPAVLNLGTRLAQDGSKGVANLQAVAAMLHVQLPMTPSATQEGQLAKLRELHGPAFDQRFEQVAQKDESKMLHQFQSGAKMAGNGAVRSAVKDMIPVVREHLQIVQGISTREASAANDAVR